MLEPQAGLATTRERIESSLALVSVHLQRDKEASQLLDAFGGQNCYSNPTKSGLSETDYFKLPLTQIVREENRTPLPPELLQHFQRMKCQSESGIFPEIQRAWAAVDSDLVMWNYLNGGDVVYYDGIENVILAVDLIRPKPNMFANHVHYLLAVATPSEIVILGVTLAENMLTSPSVIELHFVNEPLYTYALENVVVTKIKGARNGRIFLGSQDGSLYEFSYHAAAGWLQSRCKLTNCSTRFPMLTSMLPALFRSMDPIAEVCVDNARQIIYTLSEKGIISVYDLGVDGTETSFVVSAGEETLLKTVSDCDPAQIRKIIHIESVPLNDSSHVHLIAFTQSGARLFLTTCEAGAFSNRPAVLMVLHVRSPFALPHRVNQVTNGLILRSTSLMLDQHNENRFHLISLDHFSHLRRVNQFVETYSFLVVDKNIWSISVAESAAKLQRQGEAATKFVILSHDGCQILSKLSPVEQLRHLLAENRLNVQAQRIKTFFAFYNYLEGCIMCLQIMCRGDINEHHVKQGALDAFEFYGGEPNVDAPQHLPQTGPQFHQPFPQTHPQETMLNATTLSGGSIHPQQQVMSTPFRAPAFGSNQFPVSPIGQAQMHQSMAQDVNMNPQHSPANVSGVTTFQSLSQVFTHSFKHEAIFIYFSRIIRPILDSQLAKESPPHAGESPKLSLELSAPTLKPILTSLEGLKEFLRNRVTVPESMALRAQILTTPDMHAGGMGSQWKWKAVLEEQNSLSNLLLLLNHTTEVLNLWRIVAEHDVEIISRNMKPELFARLKSIQVKDFIISDKQFLSALATAIVNCYIRDGTATASVSQQLKNFCPSIYGDEDALYTNAFEKLTNACSITNAVERETLLREALDVCRKISVENLNLHAICGLLKSAQYHRGVVSICLWAASKIDPQGFGVDFVSKNEPVDDERGKRFFEARNRCYQIVTDVLNELYHDAKRQPSASTSNYEKLLKLCCDTNDSLFHLYVFDWLVASGQRETLLLLRSADLEHYLSRRAQKDKDSISTLDLWCRYHKLNGKFDKASALLLNIARRQGADLSLAQRIEYIARAIVCAKSGGPSTAELFTQLEEFLELAQIQHMIYERVPDEHVKQALNSQLLLINDLYQNYAERYNLSECQLRLLRCGGYEDQELVSGLWARLIEQAHQRGELTGTLRSACQSFVNTPSYFPLDKIIANVERLYYGQNPLEIAEVLSKAGVPWTDLQREYHELYTKQDFIQLRDRLLVVLTGIVAKLAGSPELIPREGFRTKVQRILSNIDTYIVHAQSHVTNPAMTDLIQDLRRSQTILQNLAMNFW
ncbi:nuclear pore complex protein Nup155 [Galendromus occidentalis]|uniref:Nuclear pore complex protein Nup155 n=1 Tax=Galendromus occidentalis TaxID=34638 RepID=A0AAJ7WHZ6_9ACAR|nr:nuclear pore complex protein Nup155 [Galendromus occidentalis]